MTPEWKKYTGSDKQIEEIEGTESEVLLLMKSNYIVRRSELQCKLSSYELVINKYFIGNPHPYSDLIKIWADTGCPVWVRYEYRLSVGPGSETYVTDEPDFNIPRATYRLTPFED